jgi:chromosome segregation protein
MPLRLKSLELHGYKTFAAKTNFEFAEGITAIVGPNGSGKSNIADALRWVFGEQSYSLLRAKKTEDMIFAGSEQRPRAGMASAGVTFDNTDGWLPVDFSEVGLARRSYRDGRNEYLLNSQHVRLKDINELLAQSGLSERTYTILGQGLVDASLALKADERRRLFEEAAGIGLYRARREETLRRLETTRRNLDRVLDILAELEPRLKSLERQSARAQEYARLQADLRILLLEWYGFHWHRAQRDLKNAIDLGNLHAAKLAEARENYQRVRLTFTEYRDHLNGLRVKLNSWHRQSSQLHESRESTSGSLAVLDERQQTLLNNRQSGLGQQNQLSEEFKIARERLAETEAETVRLQKEYEEANTQTRIAQTALEIRLVEKSHLETNIQSTRNHMNEFSARRASLQARLDELASRSEVQTLKLKELVQAIKSAEVEAGKAIKELKDVMGARQKAEAAVQNAEAALQLLRNQQSDLESQINEKKASHTAGQAEQARYKAQLEVLEQAEQSLTGYADGAKLLLEASRRSKLGGTRGVLSNSLDVPAELEVAIAAALGDYTDAVLLETGRDAEHAISLLDSDQSGRAVLLPLDWLYPSEPLKVEKSADCIGVASDLVKTILEYRPVLDLLLGHVLVVRDRSAARRVLAGLPKNTLAVTLRGEVFHATGQVSAGKPSKPAGLGRPRLRREMQKSLSDVEILITKVGSELQILSSQSANTREKVATYQGGVSEERARLELAWNIERQAQAREESARREWDWQVSQKASIESEIVQAELERRQTVAALSVNEENFSQVQEALRESTVALASMTLDEYQEQVKFWSTSSAVTERALSDARTRQVEQLRVVDHIHSQQVSMEEQLVEIDRSLVDLENTRKNLRGQISGINTQLEELRDLIGPAEKELETSEVLEMDLQKQETEGQIALARVERTNNQIQLELGRKQEMLESLHQKIEDDFGLVDFDYASDISGPVPLPFDGMVEQLPAVEELPTDLEENMLRLRAQLRRMGAINPEAKQEYLSVKERHTFLHSQLEDLRKAETDLHQVIAELDELTRREFQKTFEDVADQFHSIFHRLFGGGAARLLLTDPDNLTETGIDIEARLPGRREQGLSLLSGGERSLTAIALVFSLLKVSPTPVCVMDEVDAMLDEANVGRFRDLLLELSKDTQFIIITHNRNTVQAADVIYGVTMGRDSASQIISLKLDEISEEYLK